jgi:hypothetical protein
LISPWSATDADLEKIGVSLEHRRKILTAIAELAGASSLKHEPAAGVEPKPRETAERRQITMMFVAPRQTLKPSLTSVAYRKANRLWAVSPVTGRRLPSSPLKGSRRP